MKFNRLLIVCIFLLAILTVGAASAADENITDTTDEVLSAEPVSENLSADTADEVELEASPGDFTELQSLVGNTSSGKTLYLDKDYVNDGSVEYRIKIYNPITIDGQGHTIDANKVSGVFGLNGWFKVVLKNINFINCEKNAVTYYDSRSNNNLTCQDCSFVNCYSNNYIGSAIHAGNAYNCIFINSDSSAIAYGNAYNCSFINCSARDYGGAIYDGNAYNCSFEDCSAGFGGGAISQGDAYNSTFINCTAACDIYRIVLYGGGAIFYGSAYNCSFEDCSSRATAGAILKGNANDCSFKDCFTKDSTVAIAYGDASNCSFVNCKALSAIHSVVAKDIICGETASISVYGENKAGYVTVTVNGQTNKIKPTYEGKKIYLSGLKSGQYDVTVEYPGNDVFEVQTVTTSFKVSKLNPIKSISVDTPYISVNNMNASYNGKNSTLIIYMYSSNVPGNVRVTVNGVIQKIMVSSTTLKVPLGVLKPGSYDIKVYYAGSENYETQTAALSFNIVKANLITGIQIKSPFIREDQKNVQFAYTSARLVISLFSEKISGDLNVTVDGKSKIVNAYGRSSINVPLGILKLGSHNIKVSYAGDANCIAQTKIMSFKVNKCKPINWIKLYGFYSNSNYNKDVPYDGEKPTLTIAMKSERVSGNVHVTVNGAAHQVIKINDSTLNVQLDILKAGVNEIKVSYAGSAYCVAQNVTLSINVVKATPISSVSITPDSVGFGDNATITATMSNNKINGNVWFTISDANNTKILTDKIPIINGFATESVSCLNLGKYKLHVYYAGNSNYNSQTIKGTFEVVKKTPIASVNVSNWAIDSNPIIKVKVNNVNGNIWFTVSDANKTKILTDKIHIEDGWAIVSVPGLNVGKYYLHIYYAGNVHYKAQTIKSSFEVTKISPELSVAKTTVDGKTVLNATVPKDARGNVKFEVNGATYKAQIVNGAAVLTLPDMAPGTYTLTSSYAGNFKYLPETKTRSITIK